MDKHSTLDPVMVSVVSLIPTGGNFLLIFFKPLDGNSGLKCKCDLIMKNSNPNTILELSILSYIDIMVISVIKYININLTVDVILKIKSLRTI